MKRVFIAIEISAEARRQATVHAESLKRCFNRLPVGWERPEKLHVTLKFLGDVPEDKLSRVSDAVSAVANEQSSFEMRLAGTGAFPERGAPRILWIGVEPRVAATRLASEIENRCAELGFERERRAFSPHMTIARLRDPAASRGLAQFHCNSTVESAGFPVCRIIVFESKFQRSGSVYSKLGAFPLDNC